MFGRYSNNPRNRESQISSTGIKGRSSVRRVFDNSQCAHVWAQQSQDNGRSNNGNFYFDGATIYSYRSGWPLGIFTQLPDGRRAIVLNVESYSNTTSGHLSDVRRAIRGLEGFETIETNCLVAKYFADAEESERGHFDGRARAFAQLLESEARDFGAFAESLTNPRKRVWGIDSSYSENASHTLVLERRLVALNTRHDALMARAVLCALDCPVTVADAHARYQAIRDAFASFYDPVKVQKRSKAATQRNARAALANARKWFGKIKSGEYVRYQDRQRFNDSFELLLSTRPETDWRDMWREYQVWRVACECNQVEAALNPRAADIRAERQWRGRSTSQITAEQWINGARGAFYDDRTFVRRVGDTLETSRGANCPFAHAVIAFRKAQECRANGTSWHRNGQTIRVGHFNVDAIDTNGNMRAGCHTLEWSEMLRLAIREVPHLVRASFGLPVVSSL